MTPPLARRPRRVLVAILATLSVLAAVGACSPSSGKNLEGTRWLLVELGGKPVASTDPEEAPDLEFAAGERKVTGSTGCNRLTGTYEINGAKLKFSPLATTRRFCAAAAATEQAFLAALTATDAYRVSDEQLELIGAGHVVAKLKAASSDPVP